METVIESVDTCLSRVVIEWYLETLAPSVHVVASRMTEDGYTLVFEGPAVQVAELVYRLGSLQEENI